MQEEDSVEDFFEGVEELDSIFKRARKLAYRREDKKVFKVINKAFWDYVIPLLIESDDDEEDDDDEEEEEKEENDDDEGEEEREKVKIEVKQEKDEDATEARGVKREREETAIKQEVGWVQVKKEKKEGEEVTGRIQPGETVKIEVKQEKP